MTKETTREQALDEVANVAPAVILNRIECMDTSSDPASLLEGTTPGPWAVSGLRVVVRDRGIIASVPSPANGGVFECMNNAALLAAAPDLLAEVERLRGILDRIAGNAYDAGQYGELEANHRLAGIRGLCANALARVKA